MKTLWRASEVPGVSGHWLGMWSWWAEDEDDAREYMDNPGFGGPCLYRGSFSEKRVLDLVGMYESQTYAWSKHDALVELADALFENEDDFIDFMDDHQGDYIHEVIDNLDSELIEILSDSYDWVRIVDSYPEGAITRCRLTELSEAERRRIKLVECDDDDDDDDEDDDED